MHLFFVWPQYLIWHVTHGVHSYWQVWGNIIWVTARFFSLGLMIRTLFAPWRRMVEHGHRAFDLKALTGNIVINLLSRGVGFSIRLSVLVVGALVTLIVSCASVLLFVVWFLAPVIATGLLAYGGFLLVTSI